ncbi:polysaccharide deacetylase family protein [Anaerovorax odorimutans]|uniref:polysaccharide deacetylase family protein n=1 Tax=Anaerovorax odorimutans TaxID=109327 RepID=UPI0003FAB215|nr:polysaccharide deacetylase family protein [Anaerovorax odorimutans]
MILKNSNNNNLSLLIAKGNTMSKKLTITYDCGGESEGSTSYILDVLKKHDIKATFFLSGEWIESYPFLAKRIAEEKHEIGNHSYSHPDFTKLSENEIIKEINKAENIIKETIGINPKPIFRFPFGSYNNNVLQLVGSLGYIYSIQWSIDPKDWKLPPSNKIVDNIIKKVSNDDIILLHNHGESTAAASDIFIPLLKEKDFQFITIGDMIKNF